MPKRIVTSGEVFSRLTVLREMPTTGRYRRIEVQCRCGIVKVVNLGSLVRGSTVSCGCFNAERTATFRKTHGRYRSAEYRVWMAMKARCSNPNHPSYSIYGGRGIAVCDRWLGKNGFENFLADVGPKPSGFHSLDRIDNEQGYSTGNCRWSTPFEQARNTRRNRTYVFNGTRMCVTDIAAKVGINVGTLRSRLRRWKSLDKAIGREWPEKLQSVLPG